MELSEEQLRAMLPVSFGGPSAKRGGGKAAPAARGPQGQPGAEAAPVDEDEDLQRHRRRKVSKEERRQLRRQEKEQRRRREKEREMKERRWKLEAEKGPLKPPPPPGFQTRGGGEGEGGGEDEDAEKEKGQPAEEREEQEPKEEALKEEEEEEKEEEEEEEEDSEENLEEDADMVTASKKVAPAKAPSTTVSSANDMFLQYMKGEMDMGDEDLQQVASSSAAAMPPPPPSAPKSGSDSDSDSGDGVGPRLPPGFRKKPKGIPASQARSLGVSSSSASSAMALPEDENPFNFPITHEIELLGHDKGVTAIGIEPSGSRMVTGSSDYNMNFYDFNGLNTSHTPFRSLEEPCGSYVMNQLQYSLTGGMILAAPDHRQCVLFDREGRKLCTFMWGDMYLVDMTNTKGHTGFVSDISWHPLDAQYTWTCSLDSTVRLWDVNTCDQTSIKVIKCKNAGNTRTGVTSLAVNSSATLVAGGCLDGSIQIFDPKGPALRPKLLSRRAHSSGEDVTSLCFRSSETVLLSRSTDGTVAVWDVRKFNDPMARFTDLPCRFSHMDVCFGPDERFFATGSSPEGSQTMGLLHFFALDTLERVQQISVTNASVQRVVWHHKLNQILVGTADKSTHMFYDPVVSHHGALLTVHRRKRKAEVGAANVQPVVKTPHSLALYKEAPSKKRQYVKARKDPIKSKEPERPNQGYKGMGGKLGTTSFSSYLMKQSGISEAFISPNEDSREVLLGLEKKVAADPWIVGNAYKETQPEKQLDYEGLRREQEEQEERIKRLERERKSRARK